MPDNNPPLAGISAPVQGQNLYHGDQISVQWKAQDDSRVSKITVSANGTEIHSSNCSTATANGSFSYTVPASGDELLLTLTATDIFNNTATTNWRYPLLDDAPPVISIRNPSPGVRLVEGEPLTINASVTDNRGVKKVEFFVETNGELLSIKKFEGPEVAEVLQSGGYFAAGTRVPHRPDNSDSSLKFILADQPPVLSVQNEAPQGTITKGSLAFCTVGIEDDFTGQVPLKFFPVHTSLEGFGANGTRAPTGYAAEADPGNAATQKPYIEFNYPEADGFVGQISLDGAPYMETLANGRMRVWPYNFDHHLLKIDLGPDYTVRYHLTLHKWNQCDAMVEEKVIDASEGVDLSSIYSDSSIYAIDILPEIINQSGQTISTWIDHIRIDSRDMWKSTSFSNSNKASFRIPGAPSATVFIKDASNGSALAMIWADAPTQSFSNNSIVGTRTIVPVQYDIQNIKVLAHGIDRFSLRRGPVPLQVLSQRSTEIDLEPPEITVQSPTNGISVGPLQRFDINVTVSDNTEGFKSLKLFQNRNELIREMAGTYRQQDYTFSYQVPKDYEGGQFELLLVAEDYSGNTQSKLLTFPVIANNPPQMTYRKLVTAGGLKTITQPERLNYGEFWVRSGDQFELTVDL